MSAPVVAYVGINGLLGKPTTANFVESAKKGDFASLRLLARSETDVTREAVAKGEGKVSAVVINYDDEASLIAALKGVDVLVSTVGWGAPEVIKSSNLLVDAGT